MKKEDSNMPKLQHIVSIADEIIPQWRVENRQAFSAYCRYLLFNTLYTQGLPICDISRELNIKRGTITYMLQRYNPNISIYEDVKAEFLDAVFGDNYGTKANFIYYGTEILGASGGGEIALRMDNGELKIFIDGKEVKICGKNIRWVRQGYCSTAKGECRGSIL